MSDRRRKAGSVEVSQELQLWSSVRGRLASLAEIQDNTEDTLASIEELQSRYAGFGSSISDDESASTRVKKEERDDGDSDLADDDDQDDEKAEIKRKLAEAYAKLLVESEQERNTAAEALESLGVLLALKAPEQLSVQDSGKRKKRRLEASSPGLSDVSGPASARASPAPVPPTPIASTATRSSSRPTTQAGPSSASMSGTNSASGGLATILPDLHLGNLAKFSLDEGGRPSTPGGTGTRTPGGTRILTKKEKRDILNAQLPLQPGRPVAFKPPANKAASTSSGSVSSGGKGRGSKASTPTGADTGSTDWIQARIVRCIQGDKNRYEVQDVDDADGAEGRPGATYNTTLRAILVLPDPRDRSTYPPAPYPVGSDVIALYPETTAFYRAKVVGTPGSGKKQQYKLIFEDDDDAVKYVSADHVVDVP